MENIKGLTYKDIENYDAYTKNEFGKLILKFGFISILYNNAIHCDLHPGNILILPNNVIGIIDTGLVIELSPSESRYCIDLIKAYTGIGDSKYTMAELIVHNQKKGYQEVINPEIFIQDVDNIIVDYHNTKSISIQEGVNFSLKCIQTHNVVIPASFASLMLSFTLVHGIGDALDNTVTMIQISHWIAKTYGLTNAPIITS